jgi:hypothetical protein
MKQEIVKAVLRGATVAYLADESVNVYPSLRDMGRVRNLTANHKGRLVVDSDGGSRFRAYRQGSGPRYIHLFATENGEVKRTRKNLIVKLVLPLGIGRIRIIEALWSQMREIENYIKSLKEETVWK